MINQVNMQFYPHLEKLLFSSITFQVIKIFKWNLFEAVHLKGFY